MRNQRALLLSTVALFALALVACGGAKKIQVNASASSAGGATFAIQDIKIKKDLVYVYLRAQNMSQGHLFVQTGRIGLVDPNGQVFYHQKLKNIRVSPGADKRIKVAIRGPADWKSLPGFYVRVDGACIGESPLGIEPIRVNSPAGGAGMAQGAPVCTGAPIAGTTVQTPFGTVTTHSGGSQPQPSSGGIQRYNGPRQRVAGKDLKCAAIPLSAPAISKDLAFIMDEVLLTELQQVGFEAIGPDDINAMIGFEKVKDAVGCDDAGCIAEIGNALGVEFLVSGKVAKLENSMVLTLKIINVQETKVVARSSKIADGGENTLPRLVGEAVQELVRTAGL